MANKLEYIPEPKAPKPKKAGSDYSVFSLLQNVIDTERIMQEGVPDRYIKKLLFVFLLAILYVANTHFSNNLVRRLNKTKAEAEEMRVDFHTSQAEYMFDSKQSEVVKKVSASGIEESKVPPRIIVDNN